MNSFEIKNSILTLFFQELLKNSSQIQPFFRMSFILRNLKFIQKITISPQTSLDFCYYSKHIIRK